MCAVNSGAADLPKPSPSSRPGSRHQIKRSLTELASPGRLHRRQHHHRRQESNQDEKLWSPANITAQMRRSLDLPMSEGVTPVMSPNQSRRASILIPKDNTALDESKETKETRLLLEQEKASIRADGLKQSLADLNTFSTTMTRRLDETYYAVLEKMSTLQNTVVALKDLAENSHDICETFDKETRDLENDIIRQLSTAGHFEEQQRRISSLQNRLRQGRGQIDALASRVDTVRQRVERWERADREWQEKTRKRLKIVWSVMSVILLALIALVIGIKYATDSSEPRPDWRKSTSPNIPPWLGMSNSSPSGAETGRMRLWKAPTGDAEELRLFDEL